MPATVRELKFNSLVFIKFFIVIMYVHVRWRNVWYTVGQICDPFCKNLPIRAETTIEIYRISSYAFRPEIVFALL